METSYGNTLVIRYHNTIWQYDTIIRYDNMILVFNKLLFNPRHHVELFIEDGEIVNTLMRYMYESG